MKFFTLVLTCFLAVQTVLISAQEVHYEPNWASLDARPLPQWFDDAKLGIFIVWGVYSVPAWSPKGTYSEWYWNCSNQPNHPIAEFHKRVYGDHFRYQDFVPEFTAELFDPQQWTDIIQRSGAGYVVMTAQYHDGFCLWKSPYAWNWNSVDIGPHRDLIGEMTEAIRKTDIKMGYYYSVYEWYHPLYLRNVDEYVERHFHPQFKDLVTRYSPSILFMDGEWEHDSATWCTPELVAWLYNESPCRKEIVVNDRWGNDCRIRHGGYYTSEYGNTYNELKVGPDHKWEENQGIGASYGYNRNETIDEYRTATEILHLFIKTVSLGGNLLLDIGPTADGRIPVIMQQRLIEIGDWLKVNGDAIYKTKAWRTTKENDTIFYTCKGEDVYAISLQWPGKELVLNAPKPTAKTKVSMLGYDGTVSWKKRGGNMVIQVPQLTIDKVPCRHAYSFKVTNVE